MPLSAVRALLERLIGARHGPENRRRWWDAMRDEHPDEEPT
jgi:hypothetical protein